MCHINRYNKKSSFYTYGFKVMSMSEVQSIIGSPHQNPNQKRSCELLLDLFLY